MDTTTGSLDDYLEKSIAGFKQGQTFYETARSYLETKERLSAKECFLFHFFKKGYEYNSSIYTYGKLIKLMVEAADVDDWYNKILQETFNETDYNLLVNLEKRLNEAKEKGEVVDLTVTKHTGGLDPWSAGIANATTYLGIKVEDWGFKGTALHITPKKPYEYKTERYIDGKFDSIEDCGTVHRWDIEVEDPVSRGVEISSCANNGGD